MAIVDKLKDEIRERGGSVAGIKDIESAIKELNKLDNGGGSGGGGLTLYGPYILSNSESGTIASKSRTAIYLDKFLDNEDNEYALPTDEKVYLFMNRFETNSSANVKGVALPYYYEEDGELGIEDGYMNLYNPTEESVAIQSEGCMLYVYTTKELPLAESEGDGGDDSGNDSEES